MRISGLLNGVIVLTIVLRGAVGATALQAAESVHRSLSIGGAARDYLLSRPAQSDARPTILVLHGGLMSAEQARGNVGIEPMVDREGIVAVYPEGIGRQWNDGRQWRVGPLQRQPSTADDVAFLRALIGALVGEKIADPHRIYVTGPSNGGMMTFRLLCEAADLLAAVAAIGANMPVDLVGACKPRRPVPVLVMNGTADPWVPYGGGGIAPGGKGQVLSTSDTVGLFRRFNGCSGNPDVEQLPKRDSTGVSSVTSETWTHCSSSAPVMLYRIDGGGHRIPRPVGQRQFLVDLLLGVQNRDFDGAEAVWSFLRDKQR
jgi:polyhydroxybutyrate depolymerase